MEEKRSKEINVQCILNNRDLFSELEKTIPQTIGNLKRAEQCRAMLWRIQQVISKQHEIPAISDMIASIDYYSSILINCLFEIKTAQQNRNQGDREEEEQEQEIPLQTDPANESTRESESTSGSNEGEKETNRNIQFQIKEDVNAFVLEEAMEKTRICIFDVMMDHGQRGLNDNAENERVMEEMITYFLSSIGKLNLLIELLPHIVYFNKEDLFSLPRYHIRWRNLYTSLQYKKLASDVDLINSLKKFEKSIFLANSLCSKVYNIQNKPLKQIMALLRSAQYFFFNEEARLVTVKFQTNPDPKAAVLVWDVIEQIKMWELYVSSILDNIAHHEVIQVDASAYPGLTEELIDSELANSTIFEKYNSDPLTKKIPVDSNIDLPASNKIQMRLLCAKKMQRRPYGQPLIIGDNNKTITQSLFDGIKNIMKKTSGIGSKPSLQKNNNQTVEEIGEQNTNVRQTSSKGERQVFDEAVFHIHGGGWISMSSFSHQIYTRRWANHLKDVPIFSIDYKLLPEHKYPVAIADCFQAYCWILFNAEDYYNIKINKILIAGDSAGANMALGVCLLAHKHGIRQPDGLLLSYPAVNLSTDTYTPSFITSLFDPIVPHTFLKCCVSQYVNSGRDVKKDPFLSPILFPANILQLLPPIQMIVGEDDSLHDDTIRFMEKVLNAGNKNIKTVVYNYMRHGFLNYDYPFGFDSSIAIHDTSLMLAQLFHPFNPSPNF